MSSPTSSPPWARPRWATPRTPDRPTYGPAVGKLAGVLGWAPMPWQRQVLDVALELDPITGEWAYPVVVVTVQRQAGKSTMVGPTALRRCLLRNDQRTWYTAQTRIDARDNWMDTVRAVRRSPLRPPMAKIRESNGSESIELPNGSTYRIFAPRDEALHGKANALVVVDEGWSFSETEGTALVQAIVPSFSTTGGQLWIVSAAGTAASTWLRDYVEAGRAVVDAGRRDAFAYFEWGIGDEVDPTDLGAVAAAHPANGFTLRPAALGAAAASMKPGEFARAFGNRWTTSMERVIPDVLWMALADPHVDHPGLGGEPVAIGFDVGIDERDAAIVAGWRDEAGRPHVEVVDAGPGISWLVPRLLDIEARYAPRAFAHDSIGPVTAVAGAVARAGIATASTSTRDYAGACASFLAAIVDGTLRYTPHPDLDAAAAGAAKRPVGDGAWAWGRRASTGSIAPLVAATEALWAWDAAPPAPEPFVIL